MQSNNSKRHPNLLQIHPTIIKPLVEVKTKTNKQTKKNEVEAKTCMYFK